MLVEQRSPLRAGGTTITCRKIGKDGTTITCSKPGVGETTFTLKKNLGKAVLEQVAFSAGSGEIRDLRTYATVDFFALGSFVF